jgi:hypothetical protein
MFSGHIIGQLGNIDHGCPIRNTRVYLRTLWISSINSRKMLSIGRLIACLRRSLPRRWIGSEWTSTIYPRHLLLSVSRPRSWVSDDASNSTFAVLTSQHLNILRSRRPRGDRDLLRERRGGGHCLEIFRPEFAGESARSPRFVACFRSFPSLVSPVTDLVPARSG